jgi:EryCIII-like glycosyltransferase
MTKLIFEAVKLTGQRALVSKGWGGLGADSIGIPEGVFMLGNVPHDWLFQKVSCVVHHGGAGTTAAGIAAGKPTVIVPFFGDQQFWGAMVANAGAGPDPIPHTELTAQKLADAINFALQPSSLQRAKHLANKISQEDGAQKGAQSFHQMLPLDRMRCVIFRDRPAVWRIRKTQILLSAKAAYTLFMNEAITWDDVKLHRPQEYDVDMGPSDPISGGAGAVLGSLSSTMMGFAELPPETLKLLHIHPETREKIKEKARRHSSPFRRSRSRGANSPAEPGKSPERSTSPESAVQERASTPTPKSPSLKPPDPPASPMSFNLEGKAPYTLDALYGTTKGIGRVIGVGLRSPMDFTLAISKGFHNLSRLYGEEPRQIDRVTDMSSGFRTAGKEFGYGMIDGIAGLVTQPLAGAKRDGAAGFFKGVGRGIAGVVVKPAAAVYALPGYAMMGVYKELQKRLGSGVATYILSARIAQGFDEWVNTSEEERDKAISEWAQRLSEVQTRHGFSGVSGDKKIHLSAIKTFIDRQREKHRKNESTLERPKFGFPPPQKQLLPVPSCEETPGLAPAPTLPTGGLLSPASAAASSTTAVNDGYASDTSDQELAEAIRLSMRMASEEQKDEDPELWRAITASLDEMQHQEDERAKEEVVMEYVQRQSLAEEEFRRRKSGNGP